MYQISESNQSMGFVAPFKIDGLLERFQKSTTAAPHERADLIGQFLERINRGVKSPYKPATFRQVNGQLAKKNNHELYVFFKECERAKNFGAFFWWKLKEEKKKKLVPTS